LKPALAILAAVLLLAGCGQAKDPFVGTWGIHHEPAIFVIAKAQNGYAATFVDSGAREGMVLARHGNELAGIATLGNLRVVFDYLPATGKLGFKSSQMSSPIELSRISNSTSIPRSVPVTPRSVPSP
jgi:hypothetical protein